MGERVGRGLGGGGGVRERQLAGNNMADLTRAVQGNGTL